MHAADPTYPLYPIFCFVSVVMLFSVLLTSFVRQRWNFGVSSLCFWLFLELLLAAINAILWSDNNDVKFYVYCDIGKSDYVQMQRVARRTRSDRTCQSRACK